MPVNMSRSMGSAGIGPKKCVHEYVDTVHEHNVVLKFFYFMNSENGDQIRFYIKIYHHSGVVQVTVHFSPNLKMCGYFSEAAMLWSILYEHM